MSVYLIATMDTKAAEARFLRTQLEAQGLAVTLVDTGILKESPADVEITQKEVLGGQSIAGIKTRAECSVLMTRGLKRIIREAWEEGKLTAAISLGGSGGTTLASAAMHELPLGVPKVIVSTMASGNTLPYVYGEDILLINPVVDIQNLNFLTRHALAQAAHVLAGMLKVPLQHDDSKPAVAITGFGVTTPCVDACVARLEQEGYEVLVFHARGISGGRLMEKMIAEGHFAGVLDLTTSEVADEVGGGIYSVGEQRLHTAAKMGIPYVVTPGALEMINLAGEDTLTEQQKARVLYRHSPSSVKMRADKDDLTRAAKLFVDRLSDSTGNVEVLIPTKGWSMVNAEGQVFFDPEADEVFTTEVTKNMPEHVKVTAVDAHLNDAAFAQLCTDRLLTLMKK
ncbi:MAG: Tm-1-like ATP-binding domain-containing protein [Clostridia bacterium]|nr:Tm-1-like ATP-binding domain-containing protein [Clostridia bacterium]